MSRPVVLQGELRLEGFFAGLPCELYWWPGPRSYTGGPVAEIHTLGSPPLLAAAIRTLCQAGARLAEPGEFTLRAFLSGRIDLTQAEAVLGVVDALNSQQLTAALEQLAGGLARPLQQLRNHLVELLVHLEAGLDFPDEDLPFLTRQQLAHQIQEARQQLHRLAEQLQTRRISAEGITVVLVGRPNVGKSSLFNALLGHQQAIVSPQPGTTRDYLTGPLDLGGLRCQLVDTAGLDWVELSASQWEKAEAEQQAGVLERLPQEGGAEKPSPGEQPSLRQRGAEKDIKPTALEVPLGTPPRGVSVEVAAQQMTLRQIQQADLLLWCVDASQPMDPQQWEELVRPGLQARLMVVTKADQPIRIDLQQLAARSGQEPILTSSRTGQGLQELRRRMQEILENLMSSGGHAVMATAIRSAESIRLAGEALDRALELTGQRCPEELVAAELRLALEEIGKVSGAVYTEDLLERIFSRFCIGK
ncbi:MAG: tRNA modification GTPase [Thermoguttaceae bacterium]|nr:tRNA modification GTPase [Thermoguttaceae bacterium]